MPRIADITQLLEAIAPPALQEDYDNSGLLVGEPETEVSGVLVSLDVTEEVVDEAVAKGCNLIVSHHPIVFRPLSKTEAAPWPPSLDSRSCSPSSSWRPG